MELSKALRGIRSAVGLTQKAASEKVDLTQAYVSHVERKDAKNMRFRELERFSKAYGIPVFAILILACKDELSETIKDEKIRKSLTKEVDDILNEAIKQNKLNKAKESVSKDKKLKPKNVQQYKPTR